MTTQAGVFVRLGEAGDLVFLQHGDIVGRSPTAALQVDDARVSEAHAMVSLRGEHLVLLALRGRLRAAACLTTEVVLHRGLCVELAQGRALHIEDVRLPLAVLALRLPGGPALALRGTTSIVAGPPSPSTRAFGMARSPCSGPWKIAGASAQGTASPAR